SEFYRGYLKEGTFDALIVDVRFNGGGHVSQHLLTQLSQKVNAFVATRYQGIHTNPNYAIRGPIVAITNELAGSDGDIFSHNFKQMKIGPLIGVRTWGGVVGINGQYTLKDGTQTTQPEYSYYFRDVGFKVENYGTDPDIEVVQTPEGLAAGKDEQLDRAIEEILNLLAENPAASPDLKDFPDLSLP
ncbi:MAG: S41 family peptidase, partial [Bdellovibrionales bacterium]